MQLAEGTGGDRPGNQLERQRETSRTSTVAEREQGEIWHLAGETVGVGICSWLERQQGVDLVAS